jgi:hypothetical protein
LLTTGPSLDDKSVVAGPVILELSTPNVTVASGNSSHSSNGSNTGGQSGSKAATTNGAVSAKAGGFAFAGLFAGALSLLF